MGGCECVKLLVLSGHKSVYKVPLWGLASFWGREQSPQRKSLHFRMKDRVYGLSKVRFSFKLELG